MQDGINHFCGSQTLCSLGHSYTRTKSVLHKHHAVQTVILLILNLYELLDVTHNIAASQYILLYTLYVYV